MAHETTALTAEPSLACTVALETTNDHDDDTQTMRDETPREMLTCRECGAQFDLAQQNYYDNLCPSCIKNKDNHDEKRTWNGCHVCGEKVSPDEETAIKVRGAARDPTWVYMPAHPDCADDHTPRGVHRP